MKAMIEYLGSCNANRKIAILGDILEIGDFGKSIHGDLGEEICKNKIDILITHGENSKYIAEKATNLGMNKENIFVYDTKEEVIIKAKELIKSGDAVLIKASLGMGFNQIVDALV